MPAEDWHYVGEAGEPGFSTPFENAGTISPTAFQLESAGEVRLYGAVLCNGTAASEVFTLPEGYRPATGRYGVLTVSVVTSLGAYKASILTVADTGVVYVANVDTADTVFINGTFPITPPAL